MDFMSWTINIKLENCLIFTDYQYCSAWACAVLLLYKFVQIKTINNKSSLKIHPVLHVLLQVLFWGTFTILNLYYSVLLYT